MIERREYFLKIIAKKLYLKYNSEKDDDKFSDKIYQNKLVGKINKINYFETKCEMILIHKSWNEIINIMAQGLIKFIR